MLYIAISPAIYSHRTGDTPGIHAVRYMHACGKGACSLLEQKCNGCISNLRPLSSQHGHAGTKEEHLAKIYKRYRRQHKAWKLLCYRLMAPNSSQSLLAQPLVASSTGQPANLNSDNLVFPFIPSFFQMKKAKTEKKHHDQQLSLLYIAYNVVPVFLAVAPGNAIGQEKARAFLQLALAGQLDRSASFLES